MHFLSQSIYQKIQNACIAFIFFAGFTFFLLSLYFHNPFDNSITVHNTNEIQNICGFLGACVSDVLIQIFGVYSFLFICVFLYIGGCKIFDIKTSYIKICALVGLVFSLSIATPSKYNYNFGLFNHCSSHLKMFGGVFSLFFLYCLIYKKKKQTTFKNKKHNPNIEPVQKKEVNKTYITSTSNSLRENLISVLNSFQIHGTILDSYKGPIVSSFIFHPEIKTQLFRLVNLCYEIRELLKVSSVKIDYHINGVLIEIVHHFSQNILIENCSAHNNQNFKIPLLLGQNTVGESVYIDLANISHMLIGGIKGKTNFLNHILSNCQNTEFWLIDDIQKNEWINYKDCLLKPQNALKTIMKEAEFRYRTLNKYNVKTVAEFNATLDSNKTIKKQIQTGFDLDTGKPIFEDISSFQNPLPYKIVLIQELKTIISNPKEEQFFDQCCFFLKNLGIHIIAATKFRPSTQIQEIFSAKLCFKTYSQFESSAFINGAHYLSPYHGDALFKNINKVQRIHTILSDISHSNQYHKKAI